MTSKWLSLGIRFPCNHDFKLTACLLGHSAAKIPPLLNGSALLFALLMDRTCLCNAVDRISHGWSSSTVMGAFQLLHLALSPSQCNKEEKQIKQFTVSHYSLCQHMVPINSVCVCVCVTPCECFYFPYITPQIQSSLFTLFLHLSCSSFLSRPRHPPALSLILRFKLSLSLF